MYRLIWNPPVHVIPMKYKISKSTKSIKYLQHNLTKKNIFLTLRLFFYYCLCFTLTALLWSTYSPRLPQSLSTLHPAPYYSCCPQLPIKSFLLNLFILTFQEQSISNNQLTSISFRSIQYFYFL